ncbi:CATRA system-associated protein [Polymorphospora sp. NPDC050346]|uniref:CATRA system-associated protein n=1 Tax=Polymorphospora sp. NPDC050346 TaxID=3155780 RepID=UPI0033F7D4C6
MTDQGLPDRTELDGLLCDMSDWRLPADAWHRAGDTVDLLADAIRAGDRTTAERAEATLELVGPDRANRLGEEGSLELTPPPEDVRDRILEFPHRFGAAPRRPCWSTGPNGVPTGTDRCGAGRACLSARDRS